MALIGGYIDSEPFYDLRGEFAYPQPSFRDVSFPGERGTVHLLETEFRGDPFQLTGSIDLTTPGAIEVTQESYQTIMETGLPVTIQKRYGAALISYDGFLLLKFRALETGYSPVVVGGVNDGNYWLTTEFTLQYVLDQ